MRKVRPLASEGPRLLKQLVERGRLVLLLDIDGTLAPIVARPARARVPASTRALLHRLRSHRGVTVALVSGRRAVDARRVAGTTVDWIIGNHGFEIARGGSSPRSLGPAAARRHIRRARRAVQKVITGIDGAWLEDKGWTLAVHVRGARPSARRLASVRVRAATRGLPVTVGVGKMVLDVRPRVAWHKGAAARALLGRVGRGAGAVYAGDDLTDEYAFAALLPPVVTIKVGRGPTRARYRTASPATLAAWLLRLERRLP